MHRIQVSTKSNNHCLEVEGTYMLLHPCLDKDIKPSERQEIFKRRYSEHQLWQPDPSCFLIDAFVKSGTHYIWEIMMMLLNGSAEVHPEFKEQTFIEMNPISRLESVPKPCVYNTHMEPKSLPKSIGELRTVIMLRNPKDVMVSAFHHNLSRDVGFNSWDDHFNFWMSIARESSSSADNWWSFTKQAWKLRNKPNVLVLFYEDILKDFHKEVSKLAAFMDISVSDDLLQDIQLATNIETLRQTKLTVSDEEDINKFLCLYRKGKVGQWKDYFTVAQNIEFEKTTSSLLEECRDLYITYE